MYTVLQYLKTIRSFKGVNNINQNEQVNVHILQYNCPVPAKIEPCEMDRPVPQKYIYH
jgi:hypothetical protein